MLIRQFFILVAVLLPLSANAQYYQKDFPPEEFQARWEKMFDAMGDNAVALLQGGPAPRGYEFPRQTNNFYYLSGVETPHSYLWFDGRTREVTLFLPPRDEKLEKSEGVVLSAATADFARKNIGVDHVKSTDVMNDAWLESALGDSKPAIYIPFRPGEGYAQSRDEIQKADEAITNDYWDGRLSREKQLFSLLMMRTPKQYNRPLIEIRDLSPVLDRMRMVKSEREIDFIRRASELAGLGMMEAIRSTQAGVYEYQLDAAMRYVFIVNGAQLDAYRSITASGSANIWNGHYFRNNRQMQNGDVVLMDYAPDYHYYVSDIGRVWPVSGEYSPMQRELLSFILAYRNEILARIRPGVTPDEILADTAEAMEPYFQENKFSKRRYEKAARTMLKRGGGVFSHMVGMAVHDPGRYQDEVLQPGFVFSVDPALWVPEEKIYLRYEDTVVVTEDGVENFTDFLPSELDDLEALTREEGIVQKLPPVTQWPSDKND
ncbi:MAG: Xaa-Pro aminopeptidase [Hyphococcus sp.]|nr:MAG: Xaa-Pro aminopeptidase [Marinicaulis sp.]